MRGAVMGCLVCLGLSGCGGAQQSPAGSARGSSPSLSAPAASPSSGPQQNGGQQGAGGQQVRPTPTRVALTQQIAAVGQADQLYVSNAPAGSTCFATRVQVGRRPPAGTPVPSAGTQRFSQV